MRAITSSPSISNTANTSSRDRKIIRSAHQFEAILLNTLFGSLEKSFSELPGKKVDGESQSYHAMGMQALSTSLSDQGGIGIADMIVRSLRSRAQDPVR